MFRSHTPTYNFVTFETFNVFENTLKGLYESKAKNIYSKMRGYCGASGTFHVQIGLSKLSNGFNFLYIGRVV